MNSNHEWCILHTLVAFQASLSLFLKIKLNEQRKTISFLQMRHHWSITGSLIDMLLKQYFIKINIMRW